MNKVTFYQPAIRLIKTKLRKAKLSMKSVREVFNEEEMIHWLSVGNGTDRIVDAIKLLLKDSENFHRNDCSFR